MRKQLLHNLTGKSAVLFVAVVYSLMMIVGSTFSWITSSDTQINEFSRETRSEFKTLLSEVFVPVSDWIPGTSVTKEVRAYNAGTYDALVRISFEEMLWLLDQLSDVYESPDEEDTLPELISLSQYDDWLDAETMFDFIVLPPGTESGLEIRVNPSSVPGQYQYAIWQALPGGVGQRVSARFSANGDTLTVDDIWYWGHSVSSAETAAWGVVVSSGAASATPPLSTDVMWLLTDFCGNITIDYDDLITSLTSPSADEGKWFYNEDDGFFYYIGVIAEGGFSPPLINGLSLAEHAGSAYYGMSLKFIVYLEGQRNLKDLLTDVWGLNPLSDLYLTLETFCA